MPGPHTGGGSALPVFMAGSALMSGAGFLLVSNSAGASSLVLDCRDRVELGINTSIPLVSAWRLGLPMAGSHAGRG